MAITLDLHRNTALEGLDSPKESIRLRNDSVGPPHFVAVLAPAAYPGMNEGAGDEAGQGGEKVIHGGWAVGDGV